MKTPDRKTLLALKSLTDLGLNIVISLLLWIFIAHLVKKSFGLGNYVMLIGICLGLGSAALSFVKFCKMAVEKEKKDEKK